MDLDNQNTTSQSARTEEPTAAQLYSLLRDMAQAHERDRAEQAAQRSQLDEMGVAFQAVQSVQHAQFDEMQRMFNRLLENSTSAAQDHDPSQRPRPEAVSAPVPGTNESGTTPTTTLLATGSSQDKRKPLPVGEPFDGDKARFPAWKVHIEYKIRRDEAFIGDDQAKFHFIWSCLSTNVQSVVKSYYASGGVSGNWDPLNFLAYLEFCYKDAHAMERAQVLLDSIEQGKREPFAAFFVRFNTLLAEAGGAHWDGEQKLHRLRRALTGAMKTVALNRGVSRTSWETAIDDYHRIAVDIETASLEALHRTGPGSQSSPRDADGDTPMTTIAVAQLGTGKSQSTPRRRANWIPEDLFQQRRASGVCTRCGEGGHNNRECPNAIVINSMAAASTTSSGNL